MGQRAGRGPLRGPLHPARRPSARIAELILTRVLLLAIGATLASTRRGRGTKLHSTVGGSHDSESTRSGAGYRLVRDGLGRRADAGHAERIRSRGGQSCTFAAARDRPEPVDGDRANRGRLGRATRTVECRNHQRATAHDARRAARRSCARGESRWIAVRVARRPRNFTRREPTREVDAGLQKALGDAAQDLVYTPVSPCRLFDTRPSQGGVGVTSPGVRRTFAATTPRRCPTRADRGMRRAGRSGGRH